MTTLQNTIFLLLMLTVQTLPVNRLALIIQQRCDHCWPDPIRETSPHLHTTMICNSAHSASSDHVSMVDVATATRSDPTGEGSSGPEARGSTGHVTCSLCKRVGHVSKITLFPVYSVNLETHIPPSSKVALCRPSFCASAGE